MSIRCRYSPQDSQHVLSAPAPLLAPAERPWFFDLETVSAVVIGSRFDVLEVPRGRTAVVIGYGYTDGVGAGTSIRVVGLAEPGTTALGYNARTRLPVTPRHRARVNIQSPNIGEVDPQGKTNVRSSAR